MYSLKEIGQLYEDLDSAVTNGDLLKAVKNVAYSDALREFLRVNDTHIVVNRMWLGSYHYEERIDSEGWKKVRCENGTEKSFVYSGKSLEDHVRRYSFQRGLVRRLRNELGRLVLQ